MCTAPTDTLRLQPQTATRLFGWQEHKPKVAYTRKTAKEKIKLREPTSFYFFQKSFFYTGPAAGQVFARLVSFPKGQSTVCSALNGSLLFRLQTATRLPSRQEKTKGQSTQEKEQRIKTKASRHKIFTRVLKNITSSRQPTKG